MSHWHIVSPVFQEVGAKNSGLKICIAVWWFQMLRTTLQMLRLCEPNWFWGVIKWFSQPPRVKEKQHQTNKLITESPRAGAAIMTRWIVLIWCVHVSRFNCGKNHKSLSPCKLSRLESHVQCSGIRLDQVTVLRLRCFVQPDPGTWICRVQRGSYVQAGML